MMEHNQNRIDVLKMDIEGGEIIVVPYLKNFLKTYKPVFYISLHYVFLPESDIQIILDILLIEGKKSGIAPFSVKFIL